ncbi:MAG: Rha family transcriptional regulator [Oscillospiraceae bacterium]|nr:Rha family transcriptional regulator [Oscillospiraceae bacterium]
MQSLVYLEPNRLDAEPFTTSKIIAECAGLQHHTVTRSLRNYPEDFEAFGILGFEIQEIKGRGQPERIYRLNEQQATLLFTYLRNTPIVRAFKKELVRQFFLMRKELIQRQINRQMLKPARRQLTDAIKESEHGQWTYKQYMDLCYLTVTGKTAKALREEREAKPKANVTDYLTADEMARVQLMSERAAVFRDCGFDYAQTKAALSRIALTP